MVRVPTWVLLVTHTYGLNNDADRDSLYLRGTLHKDWRYVHS